MVEITRPKGGGQPLKQAYGEDNPNRCTWGPIGFPSRSRSNKDRRNLSSAGSFSIVFPFRSRTSNPRISQTQSGNRENWLPLSLSSRSFLEQQQDRSSMPLIITAGMDTNASLLSSFDVYQCIIHERSAIRMKIDRLRDDDDHHLTYLHIAKSFGIVLSQFFSAKMFSRLDIRPSSCGNLF